VIDPSQGIDKITDVAIANGQIAEVGVNLDRQDSVVNVDVKGKYVCPGLIDLHGHWYEGSAFGIDPHLCLNTGVTTAVDAGSSGFVNFPEFRRNCIDKTDLQLLAFVNIACLGLPTVVVGELEDLRYARPIETASILDRNRDVTVGVKVREGSMTAEHGIKALELAIAAAAKVDVPLMVHISRGADTPEILRRLRPGDILTHCYQGRGDGIFAAAEGSLLKEAVEARRRGVLFDVGHGCGSFKWDTAQRAFEHSFYPDTISTDLHRYSVEGPVYDMPTTLSKFLCLGMSIQDVVLKSTWMPAKSIRRDDQIGTLRAGTTADLFVFEIETGDFEYVDTHFQKKNGHKKVVPRLTIKEGRVINPGTYEIKLRVFEQCDYAMEKYLKETA
jgi:dihydroorotase